MCCSRLFLAVVDVFLAVVDVCLAVVNVFWLSSLSCGCLLFLAVVFSFLLHQCLAVVDVLRSSLSCGRLFLAIIDVFLAVINVFLVVIDVLWLSSLC